MGNHIRSSSKPIRECPRCGSSFVDWDPGLKRFRCLVRSCDWAETGESDPGSYNYATGSSWTTPQKER